MMRMKPIQTTKWGTACAQCASAKAKCSRQSSAPGSKCDRCERLLKQCTEQIHRPRKTRQPRQSQQRDTGSPSVDGMLDSLVSTPEYPSSPADLALDTSSVGSHLSGSQDRPALLRTSSAHSQHNVESSFTTGPGTYGANPFYAPSTLCRYRDPILEGREDLDQALLSKYRTQLMPQHPFVLIPDDVPAAALKRQRPFLMLAIRVVASFEGLRVIHGRMHQVMGYIADQVFRQAKRSLDLLMGIVVILGWHHYHCIRNNQLNNLLCLSESLISDLALNKRLPVGDGGAEDGRNVEEKRLLLGVWYLRSSAAMYIQQLTSMPFTSYMRQCLADIQDANHHSLDGILIHYIKLQHLTERIAVLKSPHSRRADFGGDRLVLEGNEQDRESQEPGAAALADCRAYLDRLVSKVPDNLKNDAMLVAHFNTVALRLYEPRTNNVTDARNVPVSSTAFSSDLRAVDALLQNTATPIKRWFQSWVAGVRIPQYPILPFYMVLQLLYAMRAMLRNLSSEQGDYKSYPFQEQQGSISRPGSAPQIIHSVLDCELGFDARDDATVVVLDRLIALGVSGPDIDKFWVALGERPDDECFMGVAADDFPEPRDDVMNTAIPAVPQGTQGAGSSRGDLHSLPSVNPTLAESYPPLDSRQTSQTLPVYQTNMLIQPPRVNSDGRGPHEFSNASGLAPTSVPVLPAGGQIAPHQDEWAQWEAGHSGWSGTSAASHMAISSDAGSQLWLSQSSQDDAPYGWGSDARY
ncbi:Zn(2)-C6 fungal-type domain-containing protein [Madurella fahalii]|uniref:Zn(2)-C6 fungal-type domain-containing protein n=1 Tax=Madurella fahalii TaxID=1157608 RepID=A0ABQ0G474_9PEZI